MESWRCKCGWRCGRREVGDAIGTVVGSAVGDVVGDTVGDVVGDAVGDVVGEAASDNVDLVLVFRADFIARK